MAHTFTEMNAISKGVAIGIMEKEKAEAGVGPSQPYVDLMGRKVRSALSVAPHPALVLM